MEFNWYDVLAVVISFVVGFLASRVSYQKVKVKLGQVSECLKAVSDALADDTITRDELKRIVESCKKIIE